MIKNLQATPGDAARAEAIANMRVFMLIFQRKFAEALTAAEQLPEDRESHEGPAVLAGKYALIGGIKKQLRDDAGAREALLRARGTIEAQIQAAPADASRRCQYGFVLAWLGEKDAALAEAKRAMDLLPEARDAFGGPDIVEAAAQVYALVGEKDRAFPLLDHLLSEPSPVTVANLKLNPLWDSLRDDPRFQALLDKYGTKA